MLRKDRLAILASILLAAAAGVLLPVSRGQESPPGGRPPAPPAIPQADAAVAVYRQAVALFDQKKFADADKLADAALKLDPELPDALLLKNRIAAELSRQNGTPPPTASGPLSLAPSPPAELLSAEQINRLRMFEMSTPELKTAKGVIAQTDLDDFWRDIILKDPAETAISVAERTRFMAPGNFAGQLAKIRDKQAIAFYDKVKLTTEPATLRTFKTRIQPIVLQNCATSGCHGGETAVSFRLYGNATQSLLATEAETYTNFLVLSTIRTGGRPMVNRADPEQSLILQYLLPKRDAVLLHSKVDGKEINIRSLSGTTDTRYRDLLEWSKALTYPQPDYAIPYKIVARDPKAPATAPAASQPR